MKVREMFGKFAEATHTGIHLEPIKAGPRTSSCTRIQIDKYWRGVVLRRER